MENYLEALTSHFIAHPIQLFTEYQWPRSKAKRKPYDVTFADRCSLSAQFLDDRSKRHQIALQIVRKWGGINGGRDEAIFAMSEENPENLIARGFDRVASWSKVLTLHDPLKYLIYDARVAFCINFILVEAGKKEGFFPMPASQNRKIGKAMEQFKQSGITFGRSNPVEGQDFYNSYLELVHKSAENLSIPAWQVEMALFARGPVYAKNLTDLPPIE